MKKTTLFIGMLSMIAIISCKKKEETPQPTETTIEVNAPAVEESKDSTSVSIGTDGVDISTKKGANETNVKIGGDDAKVEIKK